MWVKQLLTAAILISLTSCGGPPSSLLGGHYGGAWGESWGSHDDSGGVWGKNEDSCKMYGNCGKDSE